MWKAFGENLKEYCKKDISFEDIDKPFADRFTLYLQKQGHESQKNFEGYIRVGISEQAQRVGDKIKAAMEARKRVDK